MKYISHPLIRPECLEERRYQLAIALQALDTHTMVVLPTGLGKTAVALITAASRLYQEGGRLLMLAPTKPLVEQHFRFFSERLMLPDGECALFTGDTAPEERTATWERAQAVFATPQVVKNDLIAGRYDLGGVTLLVVDECHRAVGNYAYVFLARRYLTTAEKPLLLAMTASPGGDHGKVEEVMAHLGVVQVETRTEHDPDVRPYVHEREVDYLSVDLPDDLAEAVADLNRLLDSRLNALREAGFRVPGRERLSMKALNGLNAQVQARIAQRDAAGFMAASVYAEIMKVRHAVSLAESQGSAALRTYLEKLSSEGHSSKGTKASRRLAGDPVFRRLCTRAAGWEHELHPKVGLTVDLVLEEVREHPGSRTIVFASFRDTVGHLVDALMAAGVHAERFVGQATKDAEKGLTQKQQIEVLRRFREGEFPAIVSTSVGEEGLDVPSTDLVIFYEAVPSEIRSIQRKGRTGRNEAGRIIVLTTRGTADEVYKYVSLNRERQMIKGIRKLGNNNGGQAPPAPPAPQATGQTSIGSFADAPAPASPEPDAPVITADDRETSSKVVEVLSDLGMRVNLTRLEVGDYAVGDRVLVERKTVQDFADTLVERDLLGQVRALASAVTRPVLIVEGEGDLYAARDIHPNAIRGALAAITIDLGVSLIFTRSATETAEMLAVIARREGSERTERAVLPAKTYRTAQEEQEYIVAAYPEVGLKHARALLAHFGSVQAVIDAGVDDLSQVKGIGKKTAEKIRELSTRPYE
ncbi:Fanconi anemia group M protein [Methanofollis sp. W23]|uniref:DEAD/DEAH box helicase n=1 Tax=Methanofollis sp. W23 TaxID=2817849 RepID=UPI001AE2A5D7|nr:DEAD/DEAH box helicase [Methanofollis sp. W23]MBP2145829.1 Fanconi anemia group M protein [Methanofollis sp. W23]